MIKYAVVLAAGVWLGWYLHSKFNGTIPGMIYEE